MHVSAFPETSKYRKKHCVFCKSNILAIIMLRSCKNTKEHLALEKALGNDVDISHKTSVSRQKQNSINRLNGMSRWLGSAPRVVQKRAAPREGWLEHRHVAVRNLAGQFLRPRCRSPVARPFKTRARRLQQLRRQLRSRLVGLLPRREVARGPTDQEVTKEDT